MRDLTKYRLETTAERFTARQYSDYADFFIASRSQAEEQYQHAVEFVEAVKKYLEEAI